MYISEERNPYNGRMRGGRRWIGLGWLVAATVLSIALLAGVFARTTETSADTNICGTVTDTHWTVAGSPYIITCDAVLSSGTLVIDAGVSVKFEPATRLDVSATLSAQGIPGNPVIFTSNGATPASGDWAGLHFLGGSSGSILRYATVEYGSGVSIDSASPFIDYVTVQNNASSGVYLTNSGSAISHSTITDNTADSGAGIHARCSNVDIDSNTIARNTAASRGGGIHVSGFGCGSPISASVTNNDISDNSVDSYGGAGILFDSAEGTISNNVLINNSTATGNGGGGSRSAVPLILR